MQIEILPSLLAADIGKLEVEARRAEASGADALHIDVMDGHFVPNLSLGPPVVEMARRCTRLPLSVHLMLTHPDRYVHRFADAGADSLLIHIEASCDVRETLGLIRELGVRPGITINPETHVEDIFPTLADADEVLCMSVHPGYGGQAFIPEVLPKLRAVRDQARAIGKPEMHVLVDGGIDVQSAARCAAHGANAFIAGTSLFRADDMASDIEQMRRSAATAFVA